MKIKNSGDALVYERKSLTTSDMIKCAVFAALIIVGTYIKIPLGLVPFTLQFLFTNLAGLLLGRRLGATSVGVYVLLGLIGLPVFTGGGGIGYLFSPTFGYLLGFILGAYVAGFLAEKLQFKPFVNNFIAGLANLFIVYALGVIYLYFVLQMQGKGAPFVSLIVPYALVFLPADAGLAFIAALIATRVKPLLKRA